MNIKRDLKILVGFLFTLPLFVGLAWAFSTENGISSNTALALTTGIFLYGIGASIVVERLFVWVLLDDILAAKNGMNEVLRNMLLGRTDSTQTFVFDKVVNVTRRAPTLYRDLFAGLQIETLEQLIVHTTNLKQREWEAEKSKAEKPSGIEIQILGKELEQLDTLAEFLDSQIPSSHSAMKAYQNMADEFLGRTPTQPT